MNRQESGGTAMQSNIDRISIGFLTLAAGLTFIYAELALASGVVRIALPASPPPTLSQPAPTMTLPAEPRDGRSSGGVAVVLSHPEGSAHVASVEFYAAVVDAISAEQQWSVHPNRDVTRVLRPIGKGPVIGSIPTVSRDIVARAHPGINSWKGTTSTSRAKKSRESKRLIGPLQEALDTLALPGAIIVDCAPRGDTKVRGCGLYFYDRGTGRIVAAARKNFRTGIASAARWAPTLVAGLKDGIAAEEQREEREKLGAIIARPEERESATSLAVGVGGSGEQAGVRGAAQAPATLAMGNLYVGMQRKGTGLGLELSLGSARAGSGDQSTRIEQRSAALVATVGVDALDSVTWELGLAAGAAHRTVESGDGSELSATQPFMSLRPGILWAVGKGWQIGANLRLTNWFGGSVSARSGERLGSPSMAATLATTDPTNESGDAGRNFAARAIGTGFIIRKTF